jgi:hypothetical protein
VQSPEVDPQHSDISAGKIHQLMQNVRKEIFAQLQISFPCPKIFGLVMIGACLSCAELGSILNATRKENIYLCMLICTLSFCCPKRQFDFRNI